MSNIKQKLTVAAVETSTTAAAAATAVAITAGSPAAAALAAIPIMAKTVVECLLDLGRATEARQTRECQFTEEFKRQIEAIMRRLAEVSTEAERIKWRMLNYDVRTMYRLLRVNDEVRERRDQLVHPSYARPELLATAPNQLWSWDITKLPGPAKWTHFHLYVILDVFSRYVVGWMVAERESSALAEQLIKTTLQRQGILRGQLTLHADRGASMRAKPVALLLSDLGVTKTHSRPHTSDDNPYSEAHFKTLKYRPGCPQRFGSVQHARQWAQELMLWYNTDHHHSALGLMTPEAVHYGRAPELRQHRQQVLCAAFAAHPQRFVRGTPTPPNLPTQVWINQPKETTP